LVRYRQLFVKRKNSVPKETHEICGVVSNTIFENNNTNLQRNVGYRIPWRKTSELSHYI
jgi:hypothetical protein